MKHLIRTHRRAHLLGVLALPAILLAACDDPSAVDVPALAVETSATEFAETDPFIGTDETLFVEATNSGGGQLTISSIMVEGADASAFSLVDPAPVTLAAGQTAMFEVAFVPSTTGEKSAVLALQSDAPAQNRVEITIRGQAARFQYTQVDRMGIPGLNTVFNHPSGIAGFDKTSYNTASPAGDVATYTGQFETVLGAVGNADPAATAALLLPDELPVSLGASPSAFAQLTGRALSDDAVDVALFVTVGSTDLHSDNVDANDKTFRTTFPYVAAPHE